MTYCCILCFSVYAVAAEVMQPDPAALQRVMRLSPSYQDVQAMALRASRLHAVDPTALMRRARKAAWAPRVQIALRQHLDAAYDVNFADKVSVSGSGVVIGPRASTFSEQRDRTTSIDLRFQWDLERSVYRSDELMIAREARAWRTERRDLLEAVNAALSEWFHWSALRHAHGQASARRAHAQATLDALTNGAFSDVLNQGER